MPSSALIWEAPVGQTCTQGAIVLPGQVGDGHDVALVRQRVLAQLAQQPALQRRETGADALHQLLGALVGGTGGLQLA